MEQNINKHLIAPAKCGDLVQVDPERWYGKPDSDGGLAFVAKVNANGTLNVSYSRARTLSKEVLPTRIHNNPSEDHPVVALLRDERKKRKKTKKDGCSDNGGRRIIFLQ
jgi:hypothetical protein